MFETGKRITVIGGGPGGYVAAIRAAQLGCQVHLIEKDALGGTCLNRGCIPTKSLLQSVNTLWEIRKAGILGIVTGDATLNLTGAHKRKEDVVNRLVTGVAYLMKKNRIRVIKGIGSIVDHGKVKVIGDEEKMIVSDSIIIASGSESSSIPIEGIGQEGIISSDEALRIDTIPENILIIGGGYVGIEFAQIFSRMGSKVTVAEMMSQILPAEETEIAQMLEGMLKQEGIDIITSAKVKSIKTDKNGRQIVRLTDGEKEKEKIVEKILVAVGRRPYTKELGLEKLGVALDDVRIVVNERMETNVKGIYAIGDAIGGIMLAHVAMAEGRCAVENATGMNIKMDYRAIPRGIYTSPEAAMVGLTEKQAREQYSDVRIGTFPLKANGKASVIDGTSGMVKIVGESRYGTVLGVHIIGPHATEMIAEGVLGIQLEATFDSFANAIHAHPTVSESIMEAAMEAEGNALHI